MKPELVAQFQSALAGRYTIDRELGRGGMATVFLAHDRGGSEVALKLLNPDLGSTIGGDRFRREIRVATQLQHPNILGVLDSGVTEVAPGVNFLWFTMPLVRGSNVWERFEQTGEILAGQGAVVDFRVYPGMGHTINLDELARARTLIENAARFDAAARILADVGLVG